METKRCTRLVIYLLAIFISIFLLTCSSSAKLPRLANHAVILAYGDSLTYGTGAKPTESYPAILEQMVGRQVVSSGVPGEVTAEGLSRLQGVLEREKPALLIICHGGNDLLRHMDQKQAADNIRTMVRFAKKRGAAVVLVAVPSPNIALSPPSFYR
jgi:acyl-CoA thioesterase-1